MKDPLIIIARLLHLSTHLLRALRAAQHSDNYSERLQIVEQAEIEYYVTMNKVMDDDPKGELE